MYIVHIRITTYCIIIIADACTYNMYVCMYYPKGRVGQRD